MTITRYNIGTRHHNGIGFPGEMVKQADGEYVRHADYLESLHEAHRQIAALTEDYADLAAKNAELDAEKAGLESIVTAQAETIAELRGAPVAAQELVISHDDQRAAFEALLPCPKCGCPDELEIDSSVIAEASWIECGWCEFRVQQKCDEETLTERWNKRSRKKMPVFNYDEE